MSRLFCCKFLLELLEQPESIEWFDEELLLEGGLGLLLFKLFYDVKFIVFAS